MFIFTAHAGSTSRITVVGITTRARLCFYHINARRHTAFPLAETSKGFYLIEQDRAL